MKSDGEIYTYMTPEEQDKYLDKLIHSVDDVDKIKHEDLPKYVDTEESFLEWVAQL